jgi:hypothetical protein
MLLLSIGESLTHTPECEKIGRLGLLQIIHQIRIRAFRSHMCEPYLYQFVENRLLRFG